VVSLLKSQRLHDSVRATYGDEQLEDSWIPCAVVATNLTRLRRVVFTRGPTWQATLASISPPAVAKPRVIGGDLICDGGLIENMPVSAVVDHGCRHVLAANIASELTVSLQADDFPSPWRIVADRLLRGGRQTAGVPTAVEILLAATTLASEDARTAAADWQDLELSPDLGSFKSVDFKRSRELVDKAYADATAALGTHRGRHADAALWQLARRFQVTSPTSQPEPYGETLP
jgi:NTE family protein